MKVNDKQRQEIRKLNQCTNDLKKQRNNEKLKVDKLGQYDRRQSLIFEGVLQFQNENATEIILSLASKLDVNLTANDISIAHRLPIKRPRLSSESNVTIRHPEIIVVVVVLSGCFRGMTASYVQRVHKRITLSTEVLLP